MKFKRLLATLSFSLTLGVGVFAGIKANKVVKEADAAGTKTFYLLQNSDWSDWANPRIHYWGGSSSTSWDSRPTMTKVKNSYTASGITGTVYSYEVPTDSTGLLITKGTGNDVQTDNYNFTTNWGAETNNAAYFKYDGSNKLVPFKLEFVDNGYYLIGSFNSWNQTSGLLATTTNPGNSGEQMYQGFVANAGNTDLQLIKYTDGAITWHNCAGTPTYPANTYINLSDTGDNARVTVGTGRVAVLDIYVNVSAKTYSFNYSTMAVTIGSTTVSMAKNTSSSDPEFQATVSGCAIGDFVSIASHSTNIPLAPDTNDGGTNITADCKVKAVPGTLTIYYNASSGRVWLEGYSTNLSNFVNGFLADTLNGNSCPNPVLTSKNDTNVWNFYRTWHNDFTEYEKSVFQNAVTAVGNGTSYQGELQEAAARYVVLMEKYSSLQTNKTDAFIDVVIGGSNVLNPLTTSESDAGTLTIVVVSSLGLIALGAFFFMKKKKEI